MLMIYIYPSGFLHCI